MVASPAIAFLLTGAKYLGAASAAAQIGEAVLPRIGVVEPGTKLLKSGVGLVLDVLGVPNASDSQPSAPIAGAESGAPILGEASRPAPPPARSDREIRICVDCQGDNPIIAGAGDKVFLDRCETHRAEIEGVVNDVDGMYLGWAEASGIDPDRVVGSLGDTGYCGKKPSKNEDKYRGVFGGLKEDKYFAALNKWQKCVAKEKRDTAKDKAHEKAAVKGQKDKDKAIARQALAAQGKRYDAQISALKQAQADAKTAQEKAALQNQIDQLSQQKRDADALAVKVQEQAKDAAHQQQIDELKKDIAQRAQQPGGIDEMLKLVMLQRMNQPASAPASAPAIMMLNPPAQAAPAPQQQAPQVQTQFVAVPVAPDTQAFLDEEASGPSDDMDLMGADDEIEDIEIADALGLAGTNVTVGDAMSFQNLRQAWSPEEYNGFVEEFRAIEGLGGCSSSIGRCGLPLAE